jgi:hypothetical protein
MLVALVLARVIAESGGAMPQLADGDVLLIKRHDVVIGDGCTGDAGPSDAGTADAGPDDAGPGDAGCEAIAGDAVTLMVQPRFSQLTTGARFAVLMVTPAPPIVETRASDVFERLAEVTAQRVIVYEEKVPDPSLGTECHYESSGGGCGGGGGGGGWQADAPSFTPPGLGDGGLGDRDAGFSVDTIGPYEVVRARPADRGELQTWLDGLGYLTLNADLDAVTPYITRGYTVVAIRVKLDQTTEGQLTPIALTWPGSELKLPVSLGSSAGASPHETTVYIAGPGHYSLPGAQVPFSFRTAAGAEGFLTKNLVVLDADGDPDDDPIAVRDYLDPEYLDTRAEYVVTHVPVHDCSTHYEDDDKQVGWGCCRNCSAQPVRGDWIGLVGVIAFVTLKRRRKTRPN